MLSLEHIARIYYRGCKSPQPWIACQAQLDILYQFIYHRVLYYSNKSIMINVEHGKETSYLTTFGKKPSIVFKVYEHFHYHIRFHPYETMAIKVSSAQYNRDTSHLNIYEGPPGLVDELCIFRGFLDPSGHNLLWITQTFQAFIVLSKQRKFTFGHRISYTRYQYQIPREKITRILQSRKDITFPSSECKLSDPVTICHWVVETSHEQYIRTNINALMHTAPVDPMCHYFGVSVVNIPQHVISIYQKQRSFLSYVPYTLKHL